MAVPNREEDENSGYQRWYDRDPALGRALEHLRVAPDKYQAQVALNIIKIIIEHHVETRPAEGWDPILDQSLSAYRQPLYQRRWYDMEATLHSAMQVLRDCPDDLQQSVIPAVARMIEQALQQSG